MIQLHKAIQIRCSFQEVTAIRVKLCKICEHGGFSQSQSHIYVQILATMSTVKEETETWTIKFEDCC